jgi:hypothetical protein
MELEAISGAATVALTSTIVFLLIAKTWNTVSRTFNSTPSFSDRIMHEAAQQFRDELERLTSSQATYLSGILVFLVLFAAAYVLQAQQLFSGYPSWQLYAQLAFLTFACTYACFQLLKTIRARYDVKYLRDANVAIGHQLQQLSAGRTRIFHDVKTDAGIVDHVIVGKKGLYAVNVIVRRSRKRSHARLSDNLIQYANGGDDVSIADAAAKTARLQEEFCDLIGYKVRVRSVIAVPGWDIGEQSSDDHLLVNEKTIAMLSGWNDTSDHLMNEVVAELQKELASRCAVS